jgi:hypothetical protein
MNKGKLTFRCLGLQVLAGVAMVALSCWLLTEPILSSALDALLP